MKSLQLFLLALLYGLFETAYFGWNLLPGSDAEILADGIVVLIVGMAIVARGRP